MSRYLVQVACAACLLAACTSPAPPQPPPTALPSPVFTPTPLAAGPLQETFDTPDASQLLQGTTENATFAIQGGEYQVTMLKAHSLAWSSIAGVMGDGGFGADVLFHEGTPSTAAGMIFRMQDDQNFYMFSLSSDGFYALDAREEGAWRSLIEWTQWPQINTRGGTNRLLVDAQGATIRIYLNDELLDQTTDSSFASGNLALMANSFDTANVTVMFDNLVVVPTHVPQQQRSQVHVTNR